LRQLQARLEQVTIRLNPAGAIAMISGRSAATIILVRKWAAPFVVLVALLASIHWAGAVDMADDINPRTLSKFNFEGLSLSTTVDDLKQHYPSIEQVDDDIDQRLARERYTVKDLKTADVARFFFCDGQLYQLEIMYRAPRLERLGGLEAVLRKLVAEFGSADHAGESRWTWQQPNCGRRADLYGTRDGAYLVVTDMNLIPVVEHRMKRVESSEAVNLGF
jgi:hypothetical protein